MYGIWPHSIDGNSVRTLSHF